MEDHKLKEFIARGGVRITDALSPYTGYGKVDPEVLENAGRRGTRVHEWIDDYIKGIDGWNEDSGIGGYLESFKLFWYAFNPKPIIKEQRFYNEEHMITGQVDLIAEIADKRVLIDWKTSSSVNKTYPIQAAAYASIIKPDYIVDSVLIVRLDKDGLAGRLTEVNPQEHIDMFFKCLEIYREFFKNQKIPTFED